MIGETVECREAALLGRLSFLDAGASGNAVVRLYGGTRPAGPSSEPGTAMLAEIKLEYPAGSVSAGSLALAPLEPALIQQTGAPTWARVVSRNGATAFDMNAGIAGSQPGGLNPECVLSAAGLFAGGSVAIVSAVLG
jgi:hypothetical protein